MATVDNLDIQISAEVTKASASITDLSNKLDRLSGSLSGVNSRGLATLGAGVNKLSNAMNNFANNTKTADFSRLTRNLGSISKIDTSGFSDIASKMSQLSTAFNNVGTVSTNTTQVGELAKNLSKLGNKGVTNAITNIPQLATAMSNLMQTLSTVPKVSQNVIQTANALANLASQGSRVGTASGSLATSLNRYSESASRAARNSRSLSDSFRKLYITTRMAASVLRGMGNRLWKSIESSFNYIEVLNYFDAAFGQVAQNADLSSFKEMGYDTAEAYYASFAQRAEELTTKMTGFTVGENGLLQATGAVSLGLDPSQIMNYQAMFGQMASSMGVASETSLKLSQALTELGADLASVKNMDFDKVWEDMASGLAGMSRTLDKYGVNIRNVNLQQKLTELGIDANISALNQNDKALLRAIILFDSTRYAWADLSDTLSQPANQLRLIQANFQNLSRTIGNLFLPIVQKVLPYINALIIAMQRLFSWVGNLFGIDLSGISTAIGGADISGFLDQTDELGDSLGEAKKAADKLNKSVRAFDELKVISIKQDEDGGTASTGGIGSGLLDAAFEQSFAEYQKVWDEAFNNLENKAQEIADKIEKAFEPVKKLFSDIKIGDWFAAGQDVSGIVSGIFNFFSSAIDRVDWYGIGQKMGDFLAGIDWIAILKSVGNLIWQALKATLEFSAGMLETIDIGAIGISIAAFKWFHGGKEIVANSLNTLLNKQIETGIGSGSVSVSTAISLSLTVAITGFKIGNWLYENSEGIQNISDAIAEWIFKDGEEIAIARGISVALGGLSISLGGLALYEGTKNLIGSGSFGAIADGFAAKLAVSLATAWAGYNIGLSIREIKIGDKNIGEYVDEWVDTWFSGIDVIGGYLNDFTDDWTTGWSIIGSNAEDMWNNVVSFFTKSIPDWWDNTVAPWFTLEKWKKTFKNASEGLKNGWNSFVSWFQNTALIRWWNNLIGYFNPSKWNFKGIKEGLSTAWENAIGAIKGIWNKFAEWLNSKLTWTIDPVVVFGKTLFEGTTINLGKIPTFAKGGYVPTTPNTFSLFMAGENGIPEIMGTVGGRTAVAGGEEITGIREAVYQTSQQEIALLRQQNQLLQAILEKEFGITEQQIGKAAQNYSRDYTKRTGRPAYIF